MTGNDSLRVALDEYELTFGEDLDELELRENGGEPAASFSLSTIVDSLLDIMSTSVERDDMLHLARHFDSLARRIRKTIDDIEKGGE